MSSAFSPRVSSMYRFISWVLLFSFISLANCSMRGNETDRQSLLMFKSLMKDPLGALDSWNDTIHFCQWHGVTCSTRHQRVTVLNLPSFNLSGSIAPHIGNLSFLRVLNLPGNKLTGEIPPEIGYLKRLQILYLYKNLLNGEIPPNLSNCSEFTEISVAGNQLEGGIPTELGSLTKLNFLSTYINYLTGRIPASIGNLSSLNKLSLSRNGLYGSIPDSFGQLKNIQVLQLGANNLSDTIPPSIFNLSSLIEFDVIENELQGSFPTDLFTTLPNLQILGLGINNFSGPIPVSLSNASNMIKFQVGGNQFTGPMPSLAKLHRLQILYISVNPLGTGGAEDLSFLSSLVNATGLQRINAEMNYFGGRLPETISNFSTDLKYLIIGENQISGKIPSGIGNLVNLEMLSAENNLISGNIPWSIGKLQKLVNLYLHGNHLTGQLPSSIGNSTQLVGLSLRNNFLQGKLPPSLGMLHGLFGLSLSSNNFTGPVPIEIFSLSSLSIVLDLSGNSFQGILPNEVGNLINLGYLDASKNQFSGEIPTTLGGCVRLEQLYMSGNKFQGAIPESLGSLQGLEELDLSHNNMSGEIPRFLENLKLQLLNLSYNHFEGMVPVSGVFTNATATSIVGNDKLCGGPVELHLPRCALKESKRRRQNLTLKLVVSVVSVFLGVSVFALFVFLCWFKKKRRDPSSSSPDDESLLFVSYHTLHRATDGFSEARLIGVGAFGSVYKGIISEGENEKVIAVKVLNMLKRGAIKSFSAECEALRNIRHRNLVKVLTACSSIDSKGDDFKAIVYEFMANGSLENWLHPSHLAENEVSETQRNLSVLQRLSIAVDAALSLDYLHHQCEHPVVHCDLKPSNILLDEEMVAHVGDFGLARFVPRSIIEASANPSSSLGVRGSTGYVAPEYGLGSDVSTQGDVYSYGILLLELFTGKQPTDEMFDENMNLHEYVKKALPGGIEEIADQMLLQEERKRGKHNGRASTSSGKCRLIECLVSVFRVGVACSNELPKERMDISDVVAELISIRNKLVASVG